MEGRKKFDKSFKEQAVEKILAGETTTSQIAKELGLHYSMALSVVLAEKAIAMTMLLWNPSGTNSKWNGWMILPSKLEMKLGRLYLNILIYFTTVKEPRIYTAI
jgi:hypothetical protein